MVFVRVFGWAAAAMLMAMPGVAAAQFYLKSPSIASTPVTGNEPGILGDTMTGASPSVIRAAMVWNIRAALNVAALQCQFAPTLLTVPQYNAIIKDHERELKISYDTLADYFRRQGRNPREAQQLLDRFNTRVYSGFSTVSAQLIFCQTAHKIGAQALFQERGKLGELAAERLGELRNSLRPGQEMQFPYLYYAELPVLPPFADPRCWRGEEYQPRRCGSR